MNDIVERLRDFAKDYTTTTWTLATGQNSALFP